MHLFLIKHLIIFFQGMLCMDSIVNPIKATDNKKIFDSHKFDRVYIWMHITNVNLCKLQQIDRWKESIKDQQFK